MNNHQQLPQATPQDKQNLKITLILTVIFLVAIFAGLYLWKNYGQGETQGWQPHAIPVTAMEVTGSKLADNIQAVASLRAVQQVTLAAEVAGRIAALKFSSGAQVHAEQLLVQLFDGPEQAALLRAQAQQTFARQQLQRSQQLKPSGAESEDVLQQRQAAYAQAHAQVQQIQAQLRQKQIRAPFSGQLGIRQVDLGQYLNAGDTAVTLTALDTLYVEFTVPQQAFSAIQAKAKIRLHSDAYPQRTFTAQVNAIEPQLDEDTRNVLIQGTLDNKDHALRPGMYLDAALALPAKSHALMVPATAIQTSAQGYSVVVIRGDSPLKQGKAEVINVSLGQRQGNRVEVTQGLTAGDVIVTEGQNRVQPGAELSVAKLLTGNEV